MNKKFFTAGVLAFGMLLGSCDNDDDTKSIIESNTNLELSINGLANLGDDFVYEGWIIVNENPVSTGVFTINDSGDWSANSFTVDKTNLANATKFVLSIEPTVDNDPAPSATKILAADFSGNSAIVVANTIPGINTNGDGEFTEAWGKFFLRTPTDETGTNNGNDENGIWYGTPGTPPTAGLGGMPELEASSGWRYEGWVVVNGTPISTGTFISFTESDASNQFSGTEANAGPPIPGEDFLLNAPTGVTFPLDVRGKTTVISLEPYPDNSVKPFSIKPLLVTIATDAAIAPTTHNLNTNLSSFPSGSIIRK
ncbi:hypothetical protein FHR24_002528 [Wenyingzhuangia heitensis]|uniref:Anti-sigma-K factor rskA n=1 Tax=Wenyingzhuangia heitensis TaxID=1487859 RepID=A0ABX0UB44_9FLAO|nr:anti-sigma factor [Wenyingzhuangia heitensis]NIJ46050.1 hypothetical protein [Wenyingzhuangia heitensis]